MLPRLTAEESQQARERVAMGSGTFDADHQRAVLRRWDETVTPPKPVTAAPAGRPPVDVERLRTVGVGVRFVTRSTPEPS